MKNSTHFIFLLFILTLISGTTSFSQFWQANSIPSVNRPVMGLAVKNTNGHIFAATDGGGLYRSVDTGKTWQRLDTTSGMQHNFFSLAIDGAGSIYAGSYFGEAYRSTNEGASWTVSALGSATYIVTSFAFDTQGNVYAGTGGEGAFLSADHGTTWTPLMTGPINYYVMCLVVDSFGNIYLGTYGDGVYSSSDHGTTWVRDGFEFLRINSLTVASDGRLFAGTDAGVFCDSLLVDTVTRAPLKLDTVRAGWFQDTVGMLPRTYVISLASTPGGHIFAGTVHRGIYRSTDRGLSWQQTNTGLTDTVVSALMVTNSGFVFAGTRTGAVFSSIHAEPAALPSVIAPRPAPVVVALEQNYPNPFNPTTVIPFTLTSASPVSLVIYDALGREVTRLIDGVVSAGRHEAQWNASNMPSGVYFYRFQSASTAQTGKLILMK